LGFSGASRNESSLAGELSASKAVEETSTAATTKANHQHRQ
jgi:hypothetical protein